MKNDGLLKILLLRQLSRVRQKAGRPPLGWEDVIKTDLKEMGTFWEGIKKDALRRRACVAILTSGGLALW